MTTRFRDVIIALSPSWLRENLGVNFMAGTFGLYADCSADATLFGITAPWLRHKNSPDDALPPIGSERRMPQYPSESNDDYRARLLAAWDAYEGAGLEQTIIDQLRLFGFVPTLATVPKLSTWTISQLVPTPIQGPDNTGNGLRLTDDTNVGAHYMVVTLTDMPVDKMVEVRFLARCDAVRPWIRVLVDPDGAPPVEEVYVDTATRAIGATVAPGGHATLRAHTESPWVIVRARFWSQTATTMLYIQAADGDNVPTFTGDGVSWFEVADLTAGTPEPIVLRDNEAAAPDRINWWSQFWVIVPEGTHSYTSSIPSADQTGIVELIRKWKPGHWSTQRAVFITSGSLPALMHGKTANEWAALLNPEDHTALEVMF